ncbi:MAG TPA: M24 family metallopeptidase, partial [Flavipsychrobacter sp.]|nr:M24 family metallopeptidase [Flavipsychrobacter sp.]
KPGGLDQTYPFIPHPAYYWLTGRRRESEVVCYSKNDGWVEFQKEVGEDEAVWEGERTDLLVDDKGKQIRELESFLSANKFSNVYKLGQSNSSIEGKAFEFRTAMDKVRRRKDAAEVRLIESLARIAKAGYDRLEKVIKAGVSEKEIQIAFEQEIFLRGAHGVPYDSIVGSGANSAILHALPTDKKVQENEFVLIDAGVAIYNYCVDITRVYPSSKLSDQHHSLYQLVAKAHKECMAMSRPGVMWRDVHMHAAKVMTEGLVDFGVLKGGIDSLMEKEVISVFFPHGLGHLVGLHVRDTGQEENLKPKTYAGARLRVDIELEEDHLITVEPGCYFISALLDSSKTRDKYREEINWAEVEKWKGIGGVRIEDNILITADGNRNLTKDIPKSGWS